MTAANRFGLAVGPGQIERAMAATIKLWIADYLEEAARVEGYEPAQIQQPRDVITRSEFEKWPEEQIPVLLVMCGPTAGKPERHAQGAYSATWTVTVAAIVSDVDQAATHRLKLAYLLALRLLIGQHKRLKSPLFPDGIADFSEWESEDPDTLPALSERSLGSAHVIFTVGVENAMTEQAGPRTPSATPWVDPGEWPEITSTEVNVTPVPIGASVD